MYKDIVLASQVRLLEVAVERTIVVEDLPDNLDVVNGNTEELDLAVHHLRGPPMEEQPSEEFVSVSPTTGPEMQAQYPCTFPNHRRTRLTLNRRAPYNPHQHHIAPAV